MPDGYEKRRPSQPGASHCQRKAKSPFTNKFRVEAGKEVGIATSMPLGLL
jgi:hypothetical protein